MCMQTIRHQYMASTLDQRGLGLPYVSIGRWKAGVLQGRLIFNSQRSFEDLSLVSCLSPVKWPSDMRCWVADPALLSNALLSENTVRYASQFLRTRDMTKLTVR